MMVERIPRLLRENLWHFYCWRCKTDLGPPPGKHPGEYSWTELRNRIRAHIRAHKTEMRNQL